MSWKAACRAEVLEYGHIPISPWIAHLESFASLRSLLMDLLQRGYYDQTRSRCYVPCAAIEDVLAASPQQTLVLLDLLAAVVDDDSAIQIAADGAPGAVDAYSLVLFLFTHFYTREAARMDTADAWPPNDHSGPNQMEPSSPMRLAARAWPRDGQQQHHRAHLPATREHIQEHLLLQEAIIKGFPAFVARHAHALVGLVASDSLKISIESEGEEDIFEADSPNESVGGLVPQEIDRLGLLLTAAPIETEEDIHTLTPPLVTETTSSTDVPMDVQMPPLRLSAALPSNVWRSDGTVPSGAVVAWIQESMSSGDDVLEDAAMLGLSPPRVSVFDQFAPPMLTRICPGDVHALHRGMAIRCEDDISPSGCIRVMDCHDAVVYCLTPMQYATVAGCTDCIVILGAVGREVRIERCERVQLVVAARRAAINTCHDCIFYLGVNRPPILLGDNRFLQLAPHNAGYEKLVEHMNVVGVAAAPNAWDCATAISPERSPTAYPTGRPPVVTPPTSPLLPGRQNNRNNAIERKELVHNTTSAVVGGFSCASPTRNRLAGRGSLGEPASPSSLMAPVETPLQPVTLLNPKKLMPFKIPFRGGGGPLCGGPATAAHSRHGSGEPDFSAEDDPLSGLLAQGEPGLEAFGPFSPFELPREYAQAWEERMAGFAAVRAAYREAGLNDSQKREFLAAVQGHFKEWLQAGGGMREVYDLARAEKEASR